MQLVPNRPLMMISTCPDIRLVHDLLDVALEEVSIKACSNHCRDIISYFQHSIDIAEAFVKVDGGGSNRGTVPLQTVCLESIWFNESDIVAQIRKILSTRMGAHR